MTQPRSLCLTHFLHHRILTHGLCFDSPSTYNQFCSCNIVPLVAAGHPWLIISFIVPLLPVEVWSDLYIGSRGWGLGLLVLTLKLDIFFPSSRSHSDVCNHLTASLRVYSLVRIGFGPPAQQLTWGQVITRYPSSPEPESLQPLKASQTSDPCLLSCSS